MEEKQTEMSLDEVLSSIKQMVVDKDPPVLELTDMVSSDGTIVKVQNGQKEVKGKNELRDFLRLAQEKGQDSLFANSSSSEKSSSLDQDLKEVFDSVRDTASDSADAVSDTDLDSIADTSLQSNSKSVSKEKNNALPKHATCRNPMASDGTKITVNEIIREVSAPLIREWLEKNLPSLVKEVVTSEIQKMIKQN